MNDSSSRSGAGPMSPATTEAPQMNRSKRFQKILDACAAQPTDWLLAAFSDRTTALLSRVAIRRELKKRRAIIEAAEQHLAYGRDRMAARSLT
jgi:hypothetical protein